MQHHTSDSSFGLVRRQCRGLFAAIDLSRVRQRFGPGTSAGVGAFYEPLSYAVKNIKLPHYTKSNRKGATFAETGRDAARNAVFNRDRLARAAPISGAPLADRSRRFKEEGARRLGQG